MNNKDELIAKLERENSYLKSLLKQNGISYEESKYIWLDKEQNKEKTYELDVVTEIDFKVNVAEIKSAKNYTTSSLDRIKDKYPQLKVNRYVFGIKNMSFESDKSTLPIY